MGIEVGFANGVGVLVGIGVLVGVGGGVDVGIGASERETDVAVGSGCVSGWSAQATDSVRMVPKNILRRVAGTFLCVMRRP